MPKLPLSPDDLVEDVIRDFPSSSPFLRQYGIVCIKCGEPVWGTLGEIIQSKQQDPAAVIGELNRHLIERTAG